MRLVAAVAFLLRRSRAERGVLALVFVVVALTSFAVAAGPRLFDRVADEGLRYEAARGTAIQRNLQFSTVDRIRDGPDDPFELVAARGDTLIRRLPASVENLVAETRFVAEMARFRVAEPPNFDTLVTLRQQTGAEGLVDLVAGRWPARTVPDDETVEGSPPTVEIALSGAAAATIGVAVGDRLVAGVDADDPILRAIIPRPEVAVDIVVVGLFTVRDPADRAWFDDRNLAEAAIGGTDDHPIAYATALFAPASYPDLLALGLPLRYRWNVVVDAGRLDAGDLDTLVADLRRLVSTFTTGSVQDGAIILRSGLLGAIDRYQDQRATSEAALSLAALGPLTVAVGAVGLLGILVVRRRRRSLALARGRGASSSQLLAAQLWEGLLVTVPGALLGLFLAGALVSGPTSDLSASGALLVALGATALMLLATVPVARRARRDLERDDPPVFRVSPRRLVFEALVVGLSLAAVWLFRERGLTAATASGERPVFDPMLAGAPLFVGLAVGLVTIRLYPIPVRGLGWLSARRRDLVPVLGLRALGRHPTAGYLPLLILTLTVAIGTLSSVVVASLVRSQVGVSWQAVGADYRLDAPPGRSLDAAIDPRRLDGIEAAAPGLSLTDAALSRGLAARTIVQLEALDPDAYEAVVSGSPADVALSRALFGAPTGTDSGSVAAPIPALVSARLPTGSPTLATGETFTLTLRGRQLTFLAVDRPAEFPGVRSGSAFVIAPFASVAAGLGPGSVSPSAWFIRGGPALAEGLRQVAAGEPGVTVTSRHERYAQMSDAPLVAAVTGGFALAVGVAVAYAALAVVTVVALEAQRRSREVAFLRTLGVTDRQVGLLTVVEQGAPLLIALIIGVAVGLALAWLIEPGIDLAAFSGSAARVNLQVDWLSVAASSLGILAVVVLAVTVSSWVARRLEVGHALRIGEE